MEYTKDINLNRVCKRQIRYTKLKNGTSKLRTFLKNNKIILTTLSFLSILIMMDLILVNSFLQLLSRLY